MKFVEEMFNRTDLRQIVAFIACGSGGKVEQGGYEEILKSAEEKFLQTVRESCKEWDTQNRIEEQFSCVSAIWQETYLEIGMKIAAKLLLQIYDADKK